MWLSAVPFLDTGKISDNRGMSVFLGSKECVAHEVKNQHFLV